MNGFLVTGLTADHLAEPMGVIRFPSLSWRLEGGGENAVQSAWRVQAADTPDFAAPLIDTGERPGAESLNHCLSGIALESARRYWWRVWARAGEREAWSEPASFVTGLIGGFTARFVTAESDADANADAVTALEADIRVDGPVAQAYAYCSALGVYHLLLDGKRASDAELAPGWTSYRKRLLYQTVDLTDRLAPGTHRLTGLVGSGWYKGLMGFLRARNNYGDRTAFLCEVVIRYADGRVARIVTDESWRAADTGTTFADIYNGERHDARTGLVHWRPAEVCPWDGAALEPQTGCAAKIIQTLPVQAVLTTPKGETVLDFGQNLTGFVRLRVSGRAGDVAELQCFEALDAEGNVYTANLRSARQTLVYTLCGAGEEEWQPGFTFQGFRYAHVKRWPGEVRPERFAACAVHSDMPSTGEFSCSEPLVNQLWHNILWGLKGSFLDVPTDCPQRDERLGWTGDAQIFSATACILMDAYAFYRKWLADVAADQTAEGGVPHVVPDIMTGNPRIAEDRMPEQGTHSASGWADAAVIVPWNLYVAYGDRDILRAQYDSMRRWAEAMRAYAEDGGWGRQRQFGDWVALDAAEGSYYGATPSDLTCAAYYAYSTGLMAKAARALGRAEDAAMYEARHGEIVLDFQRRFFTQNGDLTVRTQTAHVLALHFGLVPKQWRARTLRALETLLDERGGHLTTGFMGTPYIAHVLSDGGAVGAAYDLVLKRNFPSWLYQVTMGATTVWEHWDGVKPDGSMWSADMNSFNHYAYGAIGEWLFRVMAGIRPDEDDPGYHTVWFTPRPGGGVTHAEAAIRTAYGRAAIRWERTGDEVTACVTVPCNARGVLSVPGEALDGALSADEDGLLTASFGAGTRTFRWRVKS